MIRNVKKILIVTRPGDSSACEIRSSMLEFLERRGVAVSSCEHDPKSVAEACDIPDNIDLVVVLGGDGTFLGVARRLLHLNAPFMGVNLGRVGFLTQLNREFWQSWLEDVLAHGVSVDTRVCLEYSILREGGTAQQGVVVNDLVVSRGEVARLIRLSVAYNGESISTMRADGLILSTPTGSSAYNISAGGPLMHAGLMAYCVTPVCPFLSSFRPMVFPAGGVTTVTVVESSADINLTADGQDVVPLHHGDEIVVRRSKTDLLVADLGPRAYFEKLKKHGFLTER